MTTTRRLPPEEWARLDQTEAGWFAHHLPAGSHVIAVERDGALIGSWIAMPIWHAECVWIAPAYRGRSSVARRLWTAMRALMTELGIAQIATSAAADDVRTLIAHLGGQLVPGELYMLPRDKERPVCRS